MFSSLFLIILYYTPDELSIYKIYNIKFSFLCNLSVIIYLYSVHILLTITGWEMTSGRITFFRLLYKMHKPTKPINQIASDTQNTKAARVRPTRAVRGIFIFRDILFSKIFLFSRGCINFRGMFIFRGAYFYNMFLVASGGRIAEKSQIKESLNRPPQFY